MLFELNDDDGAGLFHLHAGYWDVTIHQRALGVGYEFADWGKSEPGRALGQTRNSGVDLNHLYTNGVLFNLT